MIDWFLAANGLLSVVYIYNLHAARSKNENRA
jgi:hypothetical protein